MAPAALHIILWTEFFNTHRHSSICMPLLNSTTTSIQTCVRAGNQVIPISCVEPVGHSHSKDFYRPIFLSWSKTINIAAAHWAGWEKLFEEGTQEWLSLGVSMLHDHATPHSARWPQRGWSIVGGKCWKMHQTAQTQYLGIQFFWV